MPVLYFCTLLGSSVVSCNARGKFRSVAWSILPSVPRAGSARPLQLSSCKHVPRYPGHFGMNIGKAIHLGIRDPRPNSPLGCPARWVSPLAIQLGSRPSGRSWQAGSVVYAFLTLDFQVSVCTLYNCRHNASRVVSIHPHYTIGHAVFSVDRGLGTVVPSVTADGARVTSSLPQGTHNDDLETRLVKISTKTAAFGRWL